MNKSEVVLFSNLMRKVVDGNPDFPSFRNKTSQYEWLLFMLNLEKGIIVDTNYIAKFSVVMQPATCNSLKLTSMPKNQMTIGTQFYVSIDSQPPLRPIFFFWNYLFWLLIWYNWFWKKIIWKLYNGHFIDLTYHQKSIL